MGMVVRPYGRASPLVLPMIRFTNGGPLGSRLMRALTREGRASAMRKPRDPASECVMRIAGPMRSKRAAPAFWFAIWTMVWSEWIESLSKPTMIRYFEMLGKTFKESTYGVVLKLNLRSVKGVKCRITSFSRLSTLRISREHPLVYVHFSFHIVCC